MMDALETLLALGPVRVLDPEPPPGWWSQFGHLSSRQGVGDKVASFVFEWAIDWRSRVIATGNRRIPAPGHDSRRRLPRATGLQPAARR